MTAHQDVAGLVIGDLHLRIAQGPTCPRCNENGFDDWWHDGSCKSAHSPVVDINARLKCPSCGIFFSVTKYHDGETHSSYRSRAARAFIAGNGGKDAER